MRLQPTRIGVRDEYAPTSGRQNLTLWSGSFYSVFEGDARELPGHKGFMVTLEYGPRLRVECPAPRTDRNYEQVDAAIRNAIEKAERKADAATLARVAAEQPAPAAQPEPATVYRVWASFDGHNVLPVSSTFDTEQAARDWATAGLNTDDFRVDPEDAD